MSTVHLKAITKKFDRAFGGEILNYHQSTSTVLLKASTTFSHRAPGGKAGGSQQLEDLLVYRGPYPGTGFW